MPGLINLMLRAFRENLRVLDALAIPLIPSALRIYQWMPAPLLRSIVQHLMNTRDAEIVMAAHANAARDEMKLLATEFTALARKSTVATPALDHLYDCANPPLQ